MRTLLRSTLLLAAVLLAAACSSDPTGPDLAVPGSQPPLTERIPAAPVEAATMCALPNHNSGPACAKASLTMSGTMAALLKQCATLSWTCLAATIPAAIAWVDWSTTRDAFGHTGSEPGLPWKDPEETMGSNIRGAP